jgi:heme-degrading monooxygenase HmoA
MRNESLNQRASLRCTKWVALAVSMSLAAFIFACNDGSAASPAGPDSGLQAPKADGQSKRVRAFYRWKVKAGQEDRFVKAWSDQTAAMRSRVKGARGGFLLRSQSEPSQLLAVARWESRVDQEAFGNGKPLGDGLSQAMSEAGALVSTEIFDEVEDRLDYESWKGKLVRVYKMSIEPGKEKSFTDAWLKATIAITGKIKGARGSLLMKDPQATSRFVEIVRWESMQDWRAFIAADPADPEAFEKIFALMTLLSAETFDEVEKNLY